MCDLWCSGRVKVTGNIYPSRTPEFTHGDRKYLPFQSTRVHPRGQETYTLLEHQSSPRRTGNIYPSRAPEFTQGVRKIYPSRAPEFTQGFGGV
jgi:hypothetical protein